MLLGKQIVMSLSYEKHFIFFDLFSNNALLTKRALFAKDEGKTLNTSQTVIAC